MAYVEVKALAKTYKNGYQAIKNASLEIEQGEFIILLGPSGCGKSTLLRMIAGLESISAGDLIIDGQRMNDELPKDRDIAMVFQSYALYPHMTVYDNMALALKIRKVPKEEIDKLIKNIAEMLNLTPFLQVKPGQLSGGQRQRVALGRAIVRRPKVFLFDEPLSNLDAKLRSKMRQEICALHKEIGATIIYVTHDQVEAMTMGDKVVVLDQGVIQQIGSPKDLYEQPDNKFVAGFIGSPMINFIEVLVEVEAEQIVLSAENSYRQSLPRADFEYLVAYDGQKVCLGIRPEDLEVSQSDQGFVGQFDYSEYLGSESNFSMTLKNGDSIMFRTPSNGADVQGHRLLPKPERLHFFDLATEKRITRS
ncbi:glycerol-3-phosphate ABC transporter ATP-binding protein [Pasteurellaceae bacterium RH1A]|nr:glycerol-3-phosphate ABC transporter ATP-binding protein [Pasteurellaceae bacterium RH1A]